MKILFVVHSYYPEKDGVSIVTQYMAEGLCERGHEIKVITEKKDDLSDADSHKNVSIERIHVYKEGNIFRGERDKLFQEIRRFVPDVTIVVCTQAWGYDWLCEKLDDFPGKKVLWAHGYSGLEFSGLLRPYPIWNDLLHRRLYAIKNHLYWKSYYGTAYQYIAKFDKVVYISDKGNDYWYAGQHHLTNGVVIENAVEDIFFEPYEKENDPAEITFLNIANHNENKNQEMILRAFYRANLGKARLVLSGSKETSYTARLREIRKALEQKYGHKQVDILVGLERDKVYELYRHAEVFVLSSKLEASPVVVREAGAMGLAVIATGVGDLQEIEGCIFVDSEEEMAEKMQLLCNDQCALRSSARRIREYCFEHCRAVEKVEQMEKTLLELL